MIERIDVAEVACWRISTHCNRACRFCLSSSGPSRRHLDHDLPRTISRLKALGFRKLSFTGGEPLTYPYIQEAVYEGHQAGLHLVVTTNGDLLFSSRIPRWFDVLEHIKLSFYGHEPQHDALMGPGHYRQNMRLAKRLNDKGYSVSLNYMLARTSVEPVARFLRDAALTGAYHVVLQTFISTRRGGADNLFALHDVDDAIRQTGLAVDDAPAFPGGVRIHDFRRNDWLIVLDEHGVLSLPSNNRDPDHIMGSLFDTRLVPHGSTSIIDAHDALRSVWHAHRTSGAVVHLAR